MSPSRQSTPDPLRVGVIGTGAMGRDHIATLGRYVPEARVTVVHDRATELAEKVAAPVGARVATSPEALILADDVDAVLVCSPDPTHLELVLGCLEAGVPVLCEKPLAVSADGTAQVVAVEAALARERTSGRLVQVGFMRRFDPAYAELKRVVQDGSQGDPVLLHCVHRNPSNSTGMTPELVVSNAMVHELDIVRWLLEDEVVAVTTRTVRRNGTWQHGDPVVAWLDTAAGALVEVEVFVNAGYGYDVRCEAVGTTGRAALPDLVGPDFQTRFGDAYRRELGEWVDALLAGAPTGPSAWDGHRATVAAAACVESLRSGRTVEVPTEARPGLYA
jgi:myo-inositol 2-dehydrogenase / D-chiro-inositol 1-dehydrogenase